MSLIKLHPAYKKERRVWVCSYCKKKFKWKDQSRWFGRLENKTGKQEIKYVICSDICFEKSGFHKLGEYIE